MIQKIKDDLKQAMVNKDENRKNLLRVIIGHFNNEKISNPTESQIIKYMKTLKQSAVECNNQTEIDILDEYIPKDISKEELEPLISAMIIENGYSDMSAMGPIMGDLKKKYGDSINGKLVKEILNTFL